MNRFRIACTLAAVATLTASLGACARPSDGARRYSMTAGGHRRDYLVYAPSGHTGPMPVVLVLHGGGGDAAGMQRFSHFDDAADAHGFIAVYPDGYDRSWADGRGASAADAAGVDDVAFLGAVLDTVDRDFDADPARTYVTGISNGGMMSYRLACDLAGRITAFAPVAAGFPEPLAGRCAPARPVPMLEIAGTDDPIVPYTGGSVSVLGTAGRGTVRSAPDTAAAWARLDGCPGAPVASTVPDSTRDGTTTSIQAWMGCRRGPVELYTVTGGGHTWPGGSQYLPKAIVGIAARDFDASRVIAAFFASIH